MKAVAFNPLSKGQVLYASSDDSVGLYKSYDAGNNWVHIYGGTEPISQGSAYLSQLLVLSSDTSILLAGSHASNGGVYRSTDGGYHWTHPLAGISLEGQAIMEVFDKSLNQAIVYAGEAETMMLWRSLDYGVTWDTVAIIAGGADLCTIAAQPGTDSVFLCGSGGGSISRTTDKGNTWQMVWQAEVPDEYSDVPNIVFDPKDPQRAYASLYRVAPEHLLHSDDAGKTWVMDTVPPNTWTVNAAPNGYVWTGRFSASAFAEPHFLVSSDRGRTWEGVPIFDSVVDVWSARYDTSSQKLAVAANGLGAKGSGIFIGEPEAGVATGATSASELGLYPQPASDHVTLTGLPEIGRYRLVLRDLLGREVRSYPMVNTSWYDVPLTGVQAGVYMLDVIRDEMYARKAVVVR